MAKNTFVETTKLIFSSLFSRKMPYVVIGCPTINDDMFFTNISIETIGVYYNDTESFIHKVELTDTNFKADFLHQFPLLVDHIVYLDIRKFLMSMNKFKGDKYNFGLVLDNNIVSVVTYDENKKNVSKMECGQLISESEALDYLHVYESGLVPHEGSISHRIDESVLVDDNYNIIRLNVSEDKKNNILLLTGKGIIAVKEFPKKAKLEDWSLELVYEDKQTTRLNAIFTSTLVDVISVQPSMIWYLR